MRFGVREICDVVLKAKAAQKIGNKIFYANEPVIYFDTLKTSSMEGAATTVYAQGGRGNARLVAWEGERTVTFTMEDALISPEGFMILSGAGLIEGAKGKPVFQHVTETVDVSDSTRFETGDEAGTYTIYLTNMPYLPADQKGDFAYVMFMKNGDIISEPYIPEHVARKEGDSVIEKYAIDPVLCSDGVSRYPIHIADHDNYNAINSADKIPGSVEHTEENAQDYLVDVNSIPTDFDSVLIDYYVPHESDDAVQIDISADKFGGNYYLEASTLFRDQNGVDMPAEFIIPNCKIQSNFTFTMASSGDPSTFTFTMDAFPDYTRFDRSKKVLAAIQIIKEGGSQELHRHMTPHENIHDSLF